jgi:hypothetical protein
MSPRRLVVIWIDVQTHVFWVFKNDATILRITNISLIYLPRSIFAARSFSRSSFLIVQCSPHSHSPWSIVSYPMAHWQRAFWTKFILCKWALVPVWLDANIAIVHRGSHPCLNQNSRYYRLAITAHLDVIVSFLPFCQQSSPWSSVNVKRIHSG